MEHLRIDENMVEPIKNGNKKVKKQLQVYTKMGDM